MARRPGAIRMSGRACRPIRIGPPCGGTARSGAPKNKETEPALGRSWGGFGTQIHILADRRGHPLRLCVTGSPRHDSP